MRRNLTSQQVDHLRSIVRDVSKEHLWDCAMRILLGTLNYPALDSSGSGSKS